MANMLWFSATYLPYHSARTHEGSKPYRCCLTSDNPSVAADDLPHCCKKTLGFGSLWRKRNDTQHIQIGQGAGNPGEPPPPRIAKPQGTAGRNANQNPPQRRILPRALQDFDAVRNGNFCASQTAISQHYQRKLAGALRRLTVPNPVRPFFSIEQPPPQRPRHQRVCRAELKGRRPPDPEPHPNAAPTKHEFLNTAYPTRLAQRQPQRFASIEKGIVWSECLRRFRNTVSRWFLML